MRTQQVKGRRGSEWWGSGRIDYLKERLVSSLLRAPVSRWLGTSGWHWSLRLPQGLWTGWWSLAVLWEKSGGEREGENSFLVSFLWRTFKMLLVSFVVEQWGWKSKVSLDLVLITVWLKKNMKCYQVWLCCCHAINTLTQGYLTERQHWFDHASWTHPICGQKIRTPLENGDRLGFCWVKIIYYKQ